MLQLSTMCVQLKTKQQYRKQNINYTCIIVLLVIKVIWILYRAMGERA